MKKTLATLLCLSTLLSAGCSAKVPPVTDPIVTTEATEPTKPGAEIFTDELKAKLDEVVKNNKYEGIIHLTCNGKPVYQFVSGTNELGEPLSVESPMYMCSVSKQFCATSILLLRDQGKLSLDDTLEKYFPEYTIGKDITLKQVLSMRSGIVRDMPAMWKTPELYENNTPEENEAAFKEWVFSQPLDFAPGTAYAYSNSGYSLLSLIVETVSGLNYEDFVRQNIYEPVGMTHSGFITEVRDHPQWGLTFDNIDTSDRVHIIAQGAGGIVTTAADMDLFMTALQSGRLVTMESFREMTTDYSPKEAAYNYGYAMGGEPYGGWGHAGNNGTYASQVYFNGEYELNLFMATGSMTAYRMDMRYDTFNALLRTIFTAADAASN